MLMALHKIPLSAVSFALYAWKHTRCERAHLIARPALHFTGLERVSIATLLYYWYCQMQLYNIMLYSAWYQMLPFDLLKSGPSKPQSSDWYITRRLWPKS